MAALPASCKNLRRASFIVRSINAAPRLAYRSKPDPFWNGLFSVTINLMQTFAELRGLGTAVLAFAAHIGHHPYGPSNGRKSGELENATGRGPLECRARIGRQGLAISMKLSGAAWLCAARRKRCIAAVEGRAGNVAPTPLQKAGRRSPGSKPAAGASSNRRSFRLSADIDR